VAGALRAPPVGQVRRQRLWRRCGWFGKGGGVGERVEALPFNDQAVLPRKYALRSITASSSYELHQDQTGTLARGKLADVIVLDRNFFEVPAGQIMNTRVLLTMVGGRTVYRAKAPS
jgi:predicted amidohydrolase YtcJ